MKRKLLITIASLLHLLAANYTTAAIAFIIKARPNEIVGTPYSINQDLIFRFTTSDQYSDNTSPYIAGVSSYFDSRDAIWRDDYRWPSKNPMWQAFSGTGIVGNYMPSPTSSPANSISIRNSELTLDINQAPIGLAFQSGQGIQRLRASTGAPPPGFNLPTNFISPHSYFSQYAGTYVTGGLLEITTMSGSTYSMGIYEVTIHVLATPTISISPLSSTNEIEITFTGTLQTSEDLATWTTIEPQPLSPYRVTTPPQKKFWRSISN